MDGEVETSIEDEKPEVAFYEQQLTEAMNVLGAMGVTYDDYVTVDTALVMWECQSITEIVANSAASEAGDCDDYEHEPQNSGELAVELSNRSFGDAIAALDLLHRLK
ncbi:hypothetical protein HPB50_012765 [Hyalomma asiaticum]|uniref:Uncharacterized protein n=1 Tax=Hyalomma asiaticum TaxID=266040 RepID=A0ACB7TJ23_HYAAI|nr:hypothetical protein HPB50_012765 [Hyalomma asiaticum]